MAEDRDFIDEAQQEADLRFGKELSADELAMEFAKHDFETRIHHLKTMRDDASELTIEQGAKRHTYERALRNMHDRLRKVDR
jgi:hypothetical protein